MGQSLGRGTGRTSRCAQLAARPPPGPRRVSLPEPPHPGNPTRAPTGDPQRKWSLGSALGPNSPHICFPHICPLNPGSHWALPWQCWMLSCQAQSTTELRSPSAPDFAILGFWALKFEEAHGALFLRICDPHTIVQAHLSRPEQSLGSCLVTSLRRRTLAMPIPR